MKILHVVCEYPSEQRPFANTFIKSQVDSLKFLGLDIYIYDIKGHESTFNYIIAIKKIKEIIKKFKIDLIHAHYSYAGLSSIFCKANIPIVLSLMGSDLLGVPDKYGKLKLRGKIDKKLTKFISNRVDHIIVKSSKMKDHLNLAVPISVIPNGIELKHFRYIDSLSARKELHLYKNEFIILFLGNPKNLRKNFILAEKAVQKFAKEFKEVKLIAPFGISSDEVVKFMNAANVLLLTSFWEGSPNVVKEAMACNLPIVSTDVGDVKSVIKNTQNCFIVNFSEDDIFDKLRIIYQNRQRSNGLENIQSLRNEIIAEKIFKIYNELL